MGTRRASRNCCAPACFAIVATITAFVPATSAMAQCEVMERQIMYDPHGYENERFGPQIAMSEDFLVVGNRDGYGNGNWGGEASIYHRNEHGEWVYDVTVFPENEVDGDRFGENVAVWGDRVVISAAWLHTDLQDGGGVHVYRHTGDGWVFEAALQSRDHPGRTSGIPVAIEEDLVVFGHRFNDGRATDGGAAWVFRFNHDSDEWEEQATLYASDASYEDHFGVYVLIHDGAIFVGADRAGDNDGGTVYEFKMNDHNQWTETAQIRADDNNWGNAFGRGLDADGNRLVVGDRFNGEHSWQAGAVYIFGKDGEGQWHQESKILPPYDLGSEAQFGRAVAIDEDRLLVGAHLRDEFGVDAGGAYLFAREGQTDEWVFQSEIGFSRIGAYDHFGIGLDMNGDSAVIGAPDNDWEGNSSGCAVVFEIDCQPIEEEFLLEIAPAPLVSGQPAEFTVMHGRPNGQTWLLYSLDGMGETYIRNLNIVVDLEDPRLGAGPRRTDETGYTEWRAVMPVISHPFDVWFQAVQYENLSNVVATEIVLR